MVRDCEGVDDVADFGVVVPGSLRWGRRQRMACWDLVSLEIIALKVVRREEVLGGEVFGAAVHCMVVLALKPPTGHSRILEVLRSRSLHFSRDEMR